MWNVRSGTCRLRAGLGALTLGLATAAAQAGLGDAADSVVRDHAALHGTALTRIPSANFEVHEITTDQGTQVRQYVSREGTVFATTWLGPALPDLKVVLGSRYPRYAAGVQVGAGSNRVFSMDSEDLVVRVVKLPRGLAGSAIVPSLLPPGTRADDIR